MAQMGGIQGGEWLGLCDVARVGSPRFMEGWSRRIVPPGSPCSLSLCSGQLRPRHLQPDAL